MTDLIAQLDRHLLDLHLHITSGEQPSAKESQAYTQICRLALTSIFCKEVWDEPILGQLSWLFSIRPPNANVYGGIVVEIQKHFEAVKHINTFFFHILNNNSKCEDVCEVIGSMMDPKVSILPALKSSSRLEDIRKSDFTPSDKISAFISHITDDLGVTLTAGPAISKCLESIKARECRGQATALMVRKTGDHALAIALQAKVQPGNGQVSLLVGSAPGFKEALDRAIYALRGLHFIKSSDDTLFTLTTTTPEYEGNSISLSAGVGVYLATRGLVLDPYTAFTGDINLIGTDWKIGSVGGVVEKITAAKRHGFRRLFIPKENLSDVSDDQKTSIEIVPVETIIDVIIHLQDTVQPLPGDSLQVRKINALSALCQNRGWHLSGGSLIEHGSQFRVTPLHSEELRINIYDTGTHSPQTHPDGDFRDFLSELGMVDQSDVPIRKVEQKLTISDSALQKEIQNAMEKLGPTSRVNEQYCLFSFRFENGQEKLVVKQYQRGTLQLQGSAGKLFKAVLECIVPLYNVRYPAAKYSIDTFLQQGSPYWNGKNANLPTQVTIKEIPLPHIGTDESGKGDYFGPMVIAGVLLDAEIRTKLEAIGVRDSKLLSDKKCQELAIKIREICRDKFHIVEISPARYNDLYESFKKEGKNLNHLLAWGHARAIESLLEKALCDHAVADQFGDERYIQSKLMEKGKKLHLTQLPKGERYTAVAAASILARDRFLAKLVEIGRSNGIEIPKGASDVVVTAAKRIFEGKGMFELKNAVKLHHKTTEQVCKRV